MDLANRDRGSSQALALETFGLSLGPSEFLTSLVEFVLEPMFIGATVSLELLFEVLVLPHSGDHLVPELVVGGRKFFVV
jgi:hypothetical protein